MRSSALESILISVSTALDVEMAVLRKFVNELLTQLEEDIDREKLRNMLVYSKKLSAFEKKASLTRDALAELLDNGKTNQPPGVQISSFFFFTVYSSTPLPPPPFALCLPFVGGRVLTGRRRGFSRHVFDGKVKGETTGRRST
jgi:hypothetical protein